MSPWKRSDSISALVGGVAVVVAGAVGVLAARGGLGLSPEQWHQMCLLTAVVVEIAILIWTVRCIVSCDGDGSCILRCIGWFILISIFIVVILWRCLRVVVA